MPCVDVYSFRGYGADPCKATRLSADVKGEYKVADQKSIRNQRDRIELHSFPERSHWTRRLRQGKDIKPENTHLLSAGG